MTTNIDDRIMIIRFNERVLVDAFNWLTNPPHFITIPSHFGIPSDAVVIGVYPNYRTRTMDVVVRHPSFDVVPAGSEPPERPGIGDTFEAVPFNEHIRRHGQLPVLAEISTPSTSYMEVDERADGIRVMMNDLYRLANEDGCIAAAWALELIEQEFGCP